MSTHKKMTVYHEVVFKNRSTRLIRFYIIPEKGKEKTASRMLKAEVDVYKHRSHIGFNEYKNIDNTFERLVLEED